MICVDCFNFMTENVERCFECEGGNLFGDSKEYALCAGCGFIKVPLNEGICPPCKKELDKHLDKPEGRG